MSRELERELPDGLSGSECGGIAGDVAGWESGLRALDATLYSRCLYWLQMELTRGAVGRVRTTLEEGSRGLGAEEGAAVAMAMEKRGLRAGPGEHSLTRTSTQWCDSPEVQRRGRSAG